MCCFKREASNRGGSVEMGSSSAKEGVSLSSQSGGDRVVLPTATVQVLGPEGRSVSARVLLDSGSDRTFVSEDLIRRVGGKCVGSVEMCYAAFGEGRGDGVYDTFELQLTANVSPSVPTVNIEAVRVPVICAPLRRPSLPESQLCHFSHLHLADTFCGPGDTLRIDILVGQDQYWSLVGMGLYRTPEGLVAQETIFGWVVCGRVGKGPNPGEVSTPRGMSEGVSCQLLTLTDLPVGRRLWSCDRCEGEEAPSGESVLQEFEQSVSFSDGRYQVGLPWKPDGSVSQLESNRELAEARLRGLTKRLDKDPALRDKYDRVLQEMEEAGVIEEVPAGELESEYPTFYLPHRPVLKETGSLKVRPVFDASAKGPSGVSLNDCLEVGPSVLPSVSEVLIRFRRWKVAVTADLSKAFLQVGLRREDRDCHRFLWQRDGKLRVMRFCRVTFGVNSSPFLLMATIRHHLALYQATPAVTEMINNFYVDDLVSGADSEEEASDLLHEAQTVMAEAGMCLTKCVSNSPMVFDKSQTLSGSDDTSVKVLGVRWSPDDDAFSFEGVTLQDVVPTKRVLLSMIARFFDPLGFVTPFIMVAKCLFQEVWRLGLEWDDPLPVECRDVFSAWCDGLDVLKQLRVPRCYSGAQNRWCESEKELHVFSDASPKGYGAVVYLRLMFPDGSVSVSMVMSKARVAPLKQQTLPRLELLGCQLAAQLLDVTRSALQLPSNVSCKLYTDSMIALGWVRGRPERWKPYVSHRVSAIQRLSPVEGWSHCSGCDNPADLLTRGLSAEGLLASPQWLAGPAWLVLEEPVPASAAGDGEVEWAADAEECERAGVAVWLGSVAPSECGADAVVAPPRVVGGTPAVAPGSQLSVTGGV